MTPTEKPGHLMEEPQGEITLLLGEIATGNEAAKEQLISLVYDKLRRMAGAIILRGTTQ